MIFPSLTPSSRTFTPGRHPHSEIPTLNGLQTRVRTSNVILEQRLRLTFIGLTEAQMLSIELVTVPPEGANVNGAEFAVAISIAAGAGTGTASTTGFDLTVTASLVEGAATGA
jgi:hypothetical protein